MLLDEKRNFNLFFDDPKVIINNKPIYKVNSGCYCIAEEMYFYESQIDIEGPVFSTYEAAIAYARAN